MASANSTLRLVVDSKEYDATLKNAQKGLTALEASLRNAGKSFNDTDAKVMKYVSSIGTMNASATTVRGKVGEMTSAFINLSQVYNQMSAEVKSGDIGKALAASMETLKQRTLEAKEELRGLESQLSTTTDINMPSGDGGALSGAFSDFTKQFTMGNLYAQAAIKGTEAIEALGQKIVDVTKEGMRLSVEAEGIQRAFNRLDAPGLLSGLREATHGTVSDLELMKSAVQFNNFKLPLEDLGTYLAFAQQKARDTGQSVDYMVSSIVTGLGRQSVQILDNLGISAAEIRNRMKEGGDMTKVVAEIIREEMANAGDYVETASDRMNRAIAENQNAMKELGDQMRETFGDTTWEEFTTRLSTEWVKAEGDIVRGLDKVSDYLPLLIALKEAFKDAGDEAENTFSGIIDWALVCTGPLGSVVEIIRQIGKETKSASDYILEGTRSMMNAYWRAVNPFNVLFNSNKSAHPIATSTTPKVGSRSGRGGGGGSTKLTPAQQAEADMAKAEATYTNALADAEQKVIVGLMTEEDLQKTKLKLLEQIADANLNAWHLSDNDKYLTSFVNFANAAVNLRDKLMSVDDVFKQLEKDFPTVMTTSGGEEGLSFAESFASAAAADKGFGHEADVSKFVQDMFKVGLENGVDMSEEANIIMKRLFEGMEVPDVLLQGFVDELNAKLAELGIEPIKINFETGGIETVNKDVKALQAATKTTAKVVGTIGQAFNAIEDPAAKVAATVAQAIANVALAYSDSLAKTQAEKFNIWGFIAASAAAMISMSTTIASIHQATGYAEGGMIKGNSYSGDNIGGLVDGSQLVGLNAGEVVLNHAQTETLANTLENGQQGGTTSIPYVMGEQIFLGMNAFLKRSGRGELITTKG